MSVPAPATNTQARRRLGFCPAPALVAAFLSYIGVSVFPACTPAADTLPLKDQPHLRRPVAAAWIESNKLLAIANQRSGSISIVDVPNRRVLGEIAVGARLVDIGADPKGRWLATIDAEKHELIILERRRKLLLVAAARHPVSPFPVSIAISAQGTQISVASLWSRTVTIFESNGARKTPGTRRKQLGTIVLEFNPGKQEFIEGDEGRYVAVGDAFAGRVAILETQPPVLKTVHHLDGQNIKWLKSWDGLHVQYEKLPSTPPAKLLGLSTLLFQDSGSNSASVHIKRNDLLKPNLSHRSTLSALSILPYSKPDPASIRLNRRSIVAGQEVWRMLDSAVLPLGPAPELPPADRGEELFNDASFSSTGWMSCNSCHIRGHTSGGVADTFADNTTNTPKRIPTLLGTRLSDPWAWNGRFRNLDEQVKSSLETTMHVQNVTPEQVGDLTAFLHTIPPPPPLEPATDNPADQQKLARGKALFTNLGCAKCHIPPLTYTSPDTYDVGLADEAGMTKFNPPSLRGVSQGYAFFHDARAKTLEEVFTAHGHGLPRELEKQELSDLLRFLRSL